MSTFVLSMTGKKFQVNNFSILCRLEMAVNQENPWLGREVQDFLKYCCPECNEIESEENAFIEHALVNHEKARVLFDNYQIEAEDIVEVEEQVDEVQFLSEISVKTEIDPPSPNGMDIDLKIDSHHQLQTYCHVCKIQFQLKSDFQEHIMANHPLVEHKKVKHVNQNENLEIFNEGVHYDAEVIYQGSPPPEPVTPPENSPQIFQTLETKSPVKSVPKPPIHDLTTKKVNCFICQESMLVQNIANHLESVHGVKGKLKIQVDSTSQKKSVAKRSKMKIEALTPKRRKIETPTSKRQKIEPTIEAKKEPFSDDTETIEPTHSLDVIQKLEQPALPIPTFVPLKPKELKPISTGASLNIEDMDIKVVTDDVVTKIVDKTTSPPEVVNPAMVECQLCNYIAKDHMEMVTHMKTVHDRIHFIVNYYANYCVQCGIFFKNAQICRQHKKSGHIYPKRVMEKHFNQQYLQSQPIKLDNPAMVNDDEELDKKVHASKFKEDEFVKCTFCPYNTKYIQNLGNHMKKLHFQDLWSPKDSYRKWFCSRCSCMFLSSKDALQHSDQHPEDPQSVQCDFGCKFASSDLQTYANHIQTKHKTYYPQSNWLCMTCKKVFRHAADLSRHKKAQHSDKADKPKRKCEKCAFTANDESSMAQHLRTIHQANIWTPQSTKRNKPFCDLCKALFKTNKDLYDHMRDKHPEFECDRCPSKYKFYSIEIYRNHMEKIHGVKEKLIKCNICQIEMPTDEDFNIHFQEKHSNDKNGGTEPPEPNLVEQAKEEVLCEHCQFTFPSQHIFKAHLEICKSKHVCPDCDFTLGPDHENKQAEMTRHRLEVHFVGYAHKCNLCDFKSLLSSKSKLYDLNRHKVKEHGIFSIEVPKEMSKTKCDICDKEISMNLKLDQHKKHWHGILPKGFLCVKCNKEFKNKEDLESHDNFDHFDYDLCSKCNLTFSDLEAFDEHMKDCSPQYEDKRFKCKYPNCSKIWYSHVTLEKHWALDHKVFRSACDKCGEVCFSNFGLEKHKKETNHEKMVCFSCGIGFDRFHYQQYRNHIKYASCGATTAHNKKKDVTKKNCTCNICDQTFKTNKDKVKHMKKVHEVAED